MATDIQTIIVPKSTAPSLEAATRIAKRYAPKAIYTHRETEDSWRFRMRPPEDFVEGKYVTIKRAGGVSIVIGELK